MLTETKIRKLVFVLSQEIREERILEIKVVKLAVVLDAQNKISFLEVKILNTIQKTRKKKIKRKKKKNFKPEMDAVKIA